jgi:hypothetical protein
MQVQGQVGPIATSASISPGQIAPLRQGNLGDAIVSELHGRYYEPTYRGQKYHAANQAAATTAAGLTLSPLGIIISNPIGSGINVVLEKVGYAFIVAFPAASAIGLAVGYNGASAVTHTTALIPASNLVGTGASGKATVDSSSTIPTAATISNIFASGLTGTITTEVALNFDVVDLEGSVILPPGGYAYLYTSTVSGTSGFFGSFDWEEVPV